MTRCCSCLGRAVGYALLASIVVAQLNPSSSPAVAVPTFRIQTREVLVDVIVTDAKGQFLPDLRPGDFVVKEDGKPQHISGFGMHRYHAPRAVPPLQLPANQYTNFSYQEPGGAITILMLDTLNTPLREQVYARKAMTEFLKRLPPGQQVGLFILSDHPRLVQGFTSSSNALIAATKSLAPDLSLLSPSSGLAQTIASSIVSVQGVTSPGDEAVIGDMRFNLTLATLNALARSVSGYSGRKNLLWLSGHFPLRLDEHFVMNNRAGFGGHYSAAVRETAALLAASQIAVYPVDVKGLGMGIDSFEMDDLAHETGGKAFRGTNAIDDALLRGLQQGSDYYTLAYSPDNRQWNGEYRKIDVKTELKGVKLTFRRGYYAMSESKFTGDEAAKALATAIHPLIPLSTMLLVKAQVLPPDSDHHAVRIDYAVDSHEISFSDLPNQKKHASVDFMAVAWDGEFNEAGHVTDTVDADFLPETYKRLMQTGFPNHQELVLKPGSYTLRLGVIDRGSQKIGTVDVPLTINAVEPPSK